MQNYLDMREAVANRDIAAVAFDIDGTLTNSANSWIALTEALGASKDEHWKIYSKHIRGEVSYEDARDQLIKMWQATGKANKQFIEEMQQGWVIRPEAFDLMEWLRQKDYHTGLISSAAINYVEMVAVKLGVEDYYSGASLVYDEQGNLVDLTYTLEEASKKVEHLNQFCEKYGLTLGKCAVVGDGSNDIELFKATGNGLLLSGSQNEDLICASNARIESLHEVAGELDRREYRSIAKSLGVNLETLPK